MVFSLFYIFNMRKLTCLEKRLWVLEKELREIADEIDNVIAEMEKIGLKNVNNEKSF